MLQRIRDFHHWIAPFHRRFGLWHGTRIGAAVRRLEYAGRKGELVAIPLRREPPIVGRSGTYDGAVFRQIYVWGELDAPFPSTPRSIVDAGGNIGVATRYFASHFPAARLVSLEIERENLELLQRNVAHLPQVEVRAQAMWGRRARVVIENPLGRSDSFRAREQHGGAVEAIGVWELLEEMQVDVLDLLKLDIEGGEYEVFSDNAARWIPRVRMILVELHDRFRPGCTDAMHRVAEQGRYTVTRSGEYHLLSRP